MRPQCCGGRLSLLFACCLLSGLCSGESHASVDAPAGGGAMSLPSLPAPGATVANTATPAANAQTTLTISLAEMGQKSGLTLSGNQLQSGVTFTLPHDLVVTQAKISLALNVSRELAAADKNVQLMLNGQPLGSLPLGQDGGDNAVYQMDIPASIMVAANNLSFRINSGADASDPRGECEKALPDHYRVTILPASSFVLNGLRLDIGHSLNLLPRPFFDPQQMKEAQIPVSFASQPSADVIGAAALVASWFGAQAGHRDADFPVMMNELPKDNGIIIGKPGDLIGDFTLPQGDGPGLQIIDNPLNPVFKLLLVTGRNEAELRQAAWRLVSASLPVQDSLKVQPQDIPFRQPYDAPRWITTRQPASLALNDANDALTVTGVYHGAIPVAFRAAPDLFMWNEETIPVDLFYRFPSASWLDETQSHLSVSINGVFVRDLPVNKPGPFAALMHYAGFDIREEHATLQLDPYLIYGDNQLEFYFALNPTADAPCGALNSDNIRSRIDPASTIDLSHAYHFAQLPNLSYYVGASFPFTRRADFAQTLLLLPQSPTCADIQTLLDLVARAGNATGVPTGHVRVALGDPAETHDGQGLNDTDILAVGSLAQGDFIRSVLAGGPFMAVNSSLNVVAPDTQLQLKSYLEGNGIPQYSQANRYLSSVSTWRGFVSFPSSRSPKHIVVLATASDDDQLGKIHGDLASAFINSRIRGDVAIVSNDNDIHSFQVGPQFASGDLHWYLQVLWYAGQHILTLSMVGLIIALMLGSRCYVFLKNRAARRLGKGAGHE